MVEAHALDCSGDPERLERLRRGLGPPGCDGAVAAGACADVAEDLERRSPASPALADVRAAGLLADRVQAGAAHDPAQLRVAAGGRRGADGHPRRPRALELRPGHGPPPPSAAAPARARA